MLCHHTVVVDIHVFWSLFHAVLNPDETSTATTATEDWLNTTREFATTWTEEAATTVETTESPLIPVLLEDSTQPMKGEP